MSRRRSILLAGTLALGACRESSSGAEDSHPISGADATGTDDDGPAGPLRLRFTEIEVADDFTMVTKIRFIPGTEELLALHKDGRISHLRLDDDRADTLGQLQVPGVYSDLDCGLLGLAFDPDFANNRFVYVSACTSLTDSGIFRLRFDPDDAAAFAASLAVVHTAGDPNAPRPWHNVGEIGFDATGALWALFGDKRVSSNGQATHNDLSAIVRVIPSHDEGGGASPAPDNPWPDDPEHSPNVYAIGLRSPWTGLVDDRGRYWFGDVGADSFEEIDVAAAPGANFGWATHEGPCSGDCDGVVDPIVSWAHEDITSYIDEDEDVRATVARVAWVGLQYPPRDGDPYAGRLDRAVLFGDYCLGFVRALELDDDGAVVRDEHLGHLSFPTGWDVGPDGYVYAATFGQCETAGLDEADPPPSGLWRAEPAD